MSKENNLQLKYTGSVKNVFASNNDQDKLWFAFTDKYSVFDWGEMPDHIANKGNALVIIGTYIFQKLADSSFWQNLPQSKALKKFNPQYLQQRFSHSVYSGNNGLEKTGLQSHFSGLDKGYAKSDVRDEWEKLEPLFSLDKNPNSYEYLKAIDPASKLLMQVLAANVDWPKHKNIMHESLYFYSTLNKNSVRRLIPLEVVFTFGRLEGSSFNRKLTDDPMYAHCLGLDSVPKVNEWLNKPVLQFTTKLEPKDRLLSWQDATALANLSPEQFEQLVELSIDIALALHALFAERNLELWDGKLEFIFDSSQEKLLLADCVGPDEIRLLYKGKHLSKEILRQYYRPTTWYDSLARARSIAAKNGKEDWQDICRDELKQSPSPLTPAVKKTVDLLYGVLTNEIVGQSVFNAHPNLEDFLILLEKSLSHLFQ